MTVEAATDRVWRLLRRFALVSLGGSGALATALLWQWQAPPTIALFLITAGMVVLGLGLARGAAGATRKAGPLLLLASMNVLLLWPELTLRVIDYRHEGGVEFGFPRKIDFTRFAPDADLFWTYPRGQAGVNTMGFRDEEVQLPKPEGVVRLLFLGDSCTDLGDPNYPTRIERLLNGEAGDGTRRVESVVMAVSGYTSHQGRVAIEKYGVEMAPDVLVIYFGWNDHWRALGEPDALKRPAEAPRSAVSSVALRSRVFQFLQAVVDRVTATGDHTPPDVVRVPLPEYRQNLMAIADAFANSGTTIVFITAPTTWYRDGVPQRHIDGGFVPDAKTALARHLAYNDIVREVAGGTPALLVDLEREFDTSPSLADLMISDGIHFSDAGLTFLAQRVSEFLQDQNVLSERGVE